MTNSDLRERAAHIARLQEQADEIKADIAAAYQAAKSAGYNPKALKAAVKIAAMESDKRAAHEQQQMDIELYLAEIEGKRLEAVA